MVEFDFTAPLYVGQNPTLQSGSSTETAKRSTGCFRALNINGVFPEISQDAFNGDVQLDYCSA